MAKRGRHVPLADIAKAAGVGIGTFYRGYPDRTALLHALEYRAYDLLIECLERIEADGLSGADAIESYLVGCLDFGHELVLPLRGVAPPLTDPAAVEARDTINAMLEGFLTAGRADGSVRADVNATDVIVCGAMVTQPLLDGPAWDRIARRHIDLFLGGLRTGTAQPMTPGLSRRDIEKTLAADDLSH